MAGTSQTLVSKDQAVFILRAAVEDLRFAEGFVLKVPQYRHSDNRAHRQCRAISLVP